jgi:ribosomal protein L23
MAWRFENQFEFRPTFGVFSDAEKVQIRRAIDEIYDGMGICKCVAAKS